MIRDYFNKLADKIAATSQFASVSSHNPDIGVNREMLLCNVLNNHLPSRMQAILGGSIIGINGIISKQIDLIIRSDNTPRFEENQRSFVIAESLVAAISVKSRLDKKSLFDCLDNLASIPQLSKDALIFNVLKPTAFDYFIDKHPTNYIYAFDGVGMDTCCEHLEEYAASRSDIPENRLPTEIVVHGQYSIRYIKEPSNTYDGTPIPSNSFYSMRLPHETRGLPLATIINRIYTYTSFMPYIDVHYHKYIDDAFNPNKT
jgi:hypothetical protein